MKSRLTLSLLCIALALPALQGCVTAAVVATGAAVGALSAHDRRSTGTQTDDETLEWKALANIPSEHKALSHVNFTAYNKRLLITGETASEDAKAAIEASARRLEGIGEVFNELGIGPVSALSSRSADSLVTSKVKARLVDSNQISANHIKVVTERGIVYLMGIVNDREAKVAVAVARTTAGVRKVVNVMEVLPDEDIRRIDNQMLGARTPPPASAPVERR